MRRMVAWALIVVAVSTAAAPAVSAESAAWRERTEVNCGTAGTLDFVVPPSEFMTAFVPFHEVGTNRVLTIQSVTVNGDTYVSKPMVDKAGIRLVTCSYVDSANRSVSITGLLTPAN